MNVASCKIMIISVVLLHVNNKHFSRKIDKWDTIISAVGSLIWDISWDLNALFFNLNASCFICPLFIRKEEGTSELLGTHNT